jgi:hypothetical protein
MDTHYRSRSYAIGSAATDLRPPSRTVGSPNRSVAPRSPPLPMADMDLVSVRLAERSIWSVQSVNHAGSTLAVSISDDDSVANMLQCRAIAHPRATAQASTYSNVAASDLGMRELEFKVYCALTCPGLERRHTATAALTHQLMREHAHLQRARPGAQRPCTRASRGCCTARPPA